MYFFRLQTLISAITAILALSSLTAAVNWSTYPQVPKTASINGFADRIYDDLPACAQPCVKFSVSNTPCPYWDTGCLCVMNQWSGQVALCIAESCTGYDVLSATSLAVSICTSAGASWIVPASIITSIQVAEGSSVAKIASEIAATQTSGTVKLAGTGVLDEATATTSATSATATGSLAGSNSTSSSSGTRSSSSSSSGPRANLVGGTQSILLGSFVVIAAALLGLF